MVVVTTRDGRTYPATSPAETDRQVTLRVVGRDATVIDKSDIQSREATPVSMMPPGLFDALTDGGDRPGGLPADARQAVVSRQHGPPAGVAVCDAGKAGGPTGCY